jgi:hypothetical protein
MGARLEILAVPPADTAQTWIKWRLADLPPSHRMTTTTALLVIAPFLGTAALEGAGIKELRRTSAQIPTVGGVAVRSEEDNDSLLFELPPGVGPANALRIQVRDGPTVVLSSEPHSRLGRPVFTRTAPDPYSGKPSQKTASQRPVPAHAAAPSVPAKQLTVLKRTPKKLAPAPAVAAKLAAAPAVAAKQAPVAVKQAPVVQKKQNRRPETPRASSAGTPLLTSTAGYSALEDMAVDDDEGEGEEEEKRQLGSLDHGSQVAPAAAKTNSSLARNEAQAKQRAEAEEGGRKKANARASRLAQERALKQKGTAHLAKEFNAALADGSSTAGKHQRREEMAAAEAVAVTESAAVAEAAAHDGGTPSAAPSRGEEVVSPALTEAVVAPAPPGGVAPALAEGGALALMSEVVGTALARAAATPTRPAKRNSKLVAEPAKEISKGTAVAPRAEGAARGRGVGGASSRSRSRARVVPLPAAPYPPGPVRRIGVAPGAKKADLEAEGLPIPGNDDDPI